MGFNWMDVGFMWLGGFALGIMAGHWLRGKEPNMEVEIERAKRLDAELKLAMLEVLWRARGGGLPNHDEIEKTERILN